jgi:peptide/nickel transport system substrate-binding protein
MKYSELRSLLVKRFNIPKERSVKNAIRQFTIAERAVFWGLVVLFVTSGVLLLWQVNNAFLVEVPLKGGSLTEGIVGTPRFINPVLAFSDADKSLVSLVYSGLLKNSGNNRTVDDLADNVVISSNGLTYTVHIKTDAKFQDNIPVTADDVVFTIQKIQNQSLKSPLYGNWSGVLATKVDSSTVTFTLKKPYTPFIDNLTLGILPKHIWKNVSDDEFSFSQFNALPVGSGHYKINSVQRDSGGIPNYYDLSAFDNSYIQNIIFKFYSSKQDLLDAYSSGQVQSIGGISPAEAVAIKKSDANTISVPLTRVFGVFFNQSHSKVLLDIAVRQALDISAPREQIITDVFNGYASPITSPLPSGLFDWTNPVNKTDMNARLASASAILKKDGWTPNPTTGVLEKKSKSATLVLSFSISTSDAPELKAVGQILQDTWKQIGVKVDVLVFETGDLNQNVIRPRSFDALLFGEVIGRDADVYPFWASSERNGPGLNIAQYANSKADKLLDTARTTKSDSIREQSYKSFVDEVAADVPAVLLYTPSYLYVVPKTVHNITFGELSVPQDRFLDVNNWYIETNKVWTIFQNK